MIRPEDIPPGFALVPIEPTSAMLDKGEFVNSEYLNDRAPIGQHMYRAPAQAVYAAMLAASVVLDDAWEMPEGTIWVETSDDGQHIRKWSGLPFAGGKCFVPFKPGDGS